MYPFKYICRDADLCLVTLDLMTRDFLFLITIHRLFSLGNHRLNTSALQLQQRFFRSRESASEIGPERYLWAYQQSRACELVPSC